MNHRLPSWMYTAVFLASLPQAYCLAVFKPMSGSVGREIRYRKYRIPVYRNQNIGKYRYIARFWRVFKKAN